MEHFWPPNVLHIWNPFRRTESSETVTLFTTTLTVQGSKLHRNNFFTQLEQPPHVADSCSKCVAHLDSKTVPNVHSKSQETHPNSAEDISKIHSDYILTAGRRLTTRLDTTRSPQKSPGSDESTKSRESRDFSGRAGRRDFLCRLVVNVVHVSQRNTKKYSVFF